MRPLETALLLADAVLVGLLLRPGALGRRPLAGAAAAWTAVALAQAFVEGARWSLVPAYALGVALLAAHAARHRRGAGGRRTVRGIVTVTTAVLVLVGAAAAALLVPVPTLPRPTGPYDVGTVAIAWTDEDRAEPFTADPDDHRELVVQAWYPAEPRPTDRLSPYVEGGGRSAAALADGFGLPGDAFRHLAQVETHAFAAAPVAGGSWPVLVLSPGLGAPRWVYAGLATDLASRGWVVVGLDHPYESAVTVLPGGERSIVAATAWPEGAAAVERYRAELVGVRAADLRSVVDRLAGLDGVLAGRLDLGRLGVLGHSMGGAAATEVLAVDPRFTAGANLDGGLADAQADLRFDQPYLVVQGEQPTRGEDYTAAYVRNRDALLDRAGAGGRLVVLPGAHHGDFSDLCAYSPALRWLGTGCGTAGPAANLRAVGDAVDDFFAAHLR